MGLLSPILLFTRKYPVLLKLCIGLCWLAPTTAGAQPPIDSAFVIRSNTFDNLVFVTNKTGLYVDSTNKITPAQIPFLQYDTAIMRKFTHRISTYLVGQPFYSRFTIQNTSDTARSWYFFPGYYFRNIRLYKDSAGQVVQLPDILPDNGEISCRLFTVPPNTTVTFYFKGNLIKCNTNWMAPTIISPKYLLIYFKVFRFSTTEFNSITYVFCGILLMMLIYSLTYFFQGKRLEYLMYALYALSMLILFFIKSLFYREDVPFYFFFEEYFDYALQLFGYYCYIVFTRRLLNTEVQYITLNKIFRIAEYFLAIQLFAYSLIYFANGPFITLNLIENIGKYFLMSIGIFYVVIGFSQNNRLMHYLLAGNIALLLLAFFSQCIIVFKFQFFRSSPTLNQAMFYYELGVVLELFFFLAGLIYKNRKELIEKVKMDEAIKLEQEKKDFEAKLLIIQAKQDERSRISADMHDELGSGVTAIRLMSELAKKRVLDQPIPEIEKISTSANELMNKMNTIIWSMSATNDSLVNLVAYIRAFATEHFENTPITCSVEVPTDIPNMEMNGEKRRNIFLVVKEALNNALKHSQSERLLLVIRVERELYIEIRDYGQGIQPDKMRKFSSGLTNMQKRMKTIGGTFSIENQYGTTIHISCPY